MEGTSTVKYQDLLDKELQIVDLKKELETKEYLLGDFLHALITYKDPNWINSDQFKEHLHKAMTNAGMQIQIKSGTHIAKLGEGSRIIQVQAK